MKNLEIMNKIWAGECLNFPALVLEESIDYNNKIGNIDFAVGREFEIAKSYYDSLLVGRDHNVKVLNATLGTYIFPSHFGARIKTFEDGHKYVESPLIKSIVDLDKVKPIKYSESYLGKQLDIIADFAEKTNGEIPIRMPDIQNPLGICEMMWESNDFYTALYDENAKVHSLLSMICDELINFVARIKKITKNIVSISWPWVFAPSKGVHLSDDTMSMVSPEMYEEFGVKYNNIISNEFGGVYLHSCTTNERYFNAIAKNRNLLSINFASQYSSDMSKIFEFFEDKCVVIPHYVYTDNPQIGTVEFFIEKIAKSFRKNSKSIIFICANGKKQDNVLNVYKNYFPNAL